MKFFTAQSMINFDQFFGKGSLINERIRLHFRSSFEGSVHESGVFFKNDESTIVFSYEKEIRFYFRYKIKITKLIYF